MYQQGQETQKIRVRQQNIRYYIDSRSDFGSAFFQERVRGHTIDRALEQVKRITGKTPDLSVGDRGYRGQKQLGNTGIEILGSPKVRDTRCRKRKKRKLFCKRAGIEAGIGHLKSAHRLECNFYRGLHGDAINIMPASAAFNFKRAMRLLLCLIKKINETLLEINASLKYAF